MTNQLRPPELDYKTFVIFWAEGSMTSAPNVTGSEFIQPAILHLAGRDGMEMLVNTAETLRIEVYDQDGHEAPEDYT